VLCAGGRYLGDVWILQLDTLTWVAVTGSGKAVQPPPTHTEDGNAPEDAAAAAPASRVLPPCAGHAVVPWGNKLLVVGGHMKVAVRSDSAGSPVHDNDPVAK
jgi:hypothetical protein